MFDEKGIHRERIAFDVTPTLNAYDTPLIGKALTSKNQRNDFETENLIAFSADRDGGDATEDLSPTLRHGGNAPEHHNAFRKMAIAFNWQSGGDVRYNVSDKTSTLQASQTPAVWHENKGGSFTEAETARALRSNASHSYQGVGVRRLTPMECERLQGFSDGYTGNFADSVRYRMLGNAVAVPIATWIGQHLAALDELSRDD